MFITCKTEWVHQVILDIWRNSANIASNNSLNTRACCVSDTGWCWTWWAWQPSSPSYNITNTTWGREKVILKNIHKNTRLNSMVFNLYTETFLWIKVVISVLRGFHHTVECVKNLHLLQHNILKLVTAIYIFWIDNWYLQKIRKWVSQQNIPTRLRRFPNFIFIWLACKALL